MNKKVIFSSIITIIILWVSQFLILGSWILNSFFPENVYLNEVVLYFYPPLLIIGFSAYFWAYKKRDIAKGIIIGGLIYCFGLWLVVSSDTSEMICQRYFFDLLTNCPGVKPGIK